MVTSFDSPETKLFGLTCLGPRSIDFIMGLHGFSWLAAPSGF